MTHRLPRIVALVAAVAAVPALFPAAASAQEPAPTIRPQQEVTGRVGEPLSEQPAEQPDVDVGAAYSFRAGAAITNAYFFRGFNQEDQGFIAQPFAELGISLLNSKAVEDDTETRYVVGEDGVRRAVVVDAEEPNKFSVDAVVGIWNSVHSEKTGFNGTGPSNWYESDQYGGLTLTTGNFSIGALYTFYTYPNGAFDTIGEVQGSIAYAIPLTPNAEDEGDVNVNLKIGALAAYETFDNNGTEDAYGELDLTPSFGVETGGTDVTVSFPFAVGLSLKDYYQDANGDDEFFGYFSVAAVVGIPIPVPASYGSWTLSGGFQYIYLNADALEAANNGDDSQINGSVALEIAF